MCGVFYIDDETLSDIRQIVREIDEKLKNERWTKDIHPTEAAPVMVAGKKGIRLVKQKWGYPGIENKGVIFNARSETALEKRMFRNGVRYHRAIIPATHFYEWNRNKEKNTFYRNDDRPLFLAGFYDVLDNFERFVILTTEANESMKRVHDRMPLVLECNQLDEWIYNDQMAENILKQTPILLNRMSELEQLSLF